MGKMSAVTATIFDKNYELHFPPGMENRMQLRIGEQVAANADFDGRTYTTQQVTIMPEQAESAQQ